MKKTLSNTSFFAAELRNTGEAKNGKADGNKPRRLSYKEKRELEQLEKDIEMLEAEQRQIEEALSMGQISVDEITRYSKRLPILKDELDEKSMRWLELSID